MSDTHSAKAEAITMVAGTPPSSPVQGPVIHSSTHILTRGASRRGPSLRYRPIHSGMPSLSLVNAPARTQAPDEIQTLGHGDQHNEVDTPFAPDCVADSQAGSSRRSSLSDDVVPLFPPAPPTQGIQHREQCAVGPAVAVVDGCDVTPLSDIVEDTQGATIEIVEESQAGLAEGDESPQTALNATSRQHVDESQHLDAERSLDEDSTAEPEGRDYDQARPQCAPCVLCSNSVDMMFHEELDEEDELYLLSRVPYDLSKEDETRPETVDVHVLCAQWNPDLFFKEGDVLVPRHSLTSKSWHIAYLARDCRPVLSALAQICSHCHEPGAGVCCRRCSKEYHYPCAVLAGCQLKILSGGMRPQTEYTMTCVNCLPASRKLKYKPIYPRPSVLERLTSCTKLSEDNASADPNTSPGVPPITRKVPSRSEPNLDDATRLTANEKRKSSSQLPVNEHRAPAAAVRSVDDDAPMENPTPKPLRRERTSGDCVLCRPGDLDDVATDSDDVGDPIRLYDYQLNTESNGQNRVVKLHQLCAQWVPDLFFRDGGIVPRNLLAAKNWFRDCRPVSDALITSCSLCDTNGAGITCRKCKKKSYHYPCAHEAGCTLRVLPAGGLRPQTEFLMWCPTCKPPKMAMKARGYTQRPPRIRAQGMDSSRRDKRAESSGESDWVPEQPNSMNSLFLDSLSWDVALEETVPSQQATHLAESGKESPSRTRELSSKPRTHRISGGTRKDLEGVSKGRDTASRKVRKPAGSAPPSKLGTSLSSSTSSDVPLASLSSRRRFRRGRGLYDDLTSSTSTAGPDDCTVSCSSPPLSSRELSSGASGTDTSPEPLVVMYEHIIADWNRRMPGSSLPHFIRVARRSCARSKWTKVQNRRVARQASKGVRLRATSKTPVAPKREHGRTGLYTFSETVLDDGNSLRGMSSSDETYFKKALSSRKPGVISVKQPKRTRTKHPKAGGAIRKANKVTASSKPSVRLKRPSRAPASQTSRPRLPQRRKRVSPSQCNLDKATFDISDIGQQSLDDFLVSPSGRRDVSRRGAWAIWSVSEKFNDKHRGVHSDNEASEAGTRGALTGPPNSGGKIESLLGRLAQSELNLGARNAPGVRSARRNGNRKKRITIASRRVKSTTITSPRDLGTDQPRRHRKPSDPKKRVRSLQTQVSFTSCLNSGSAIPQEDLYSKPQSRDKMCDQRSSSGDIPGAAVFEGRPKSHHVQQSLLSASSFTPLLHLPLSRRSSDPAATTLDGVPHILLEAGGTLGSERFSSVNLGVCFRELRMSMHWAFGCTSERSVNFVDAVENVKGIIRQIHVHVVHFFPVVTSVVRIPLTLDLIKELSSFMKTGPAYLLTALGDRSQPHLFLLSTRIRAGLLYILDCALRPFTDRGFEALNSFECPMFVQATELWQTCVEHLVVAISHSPAVVLSGLGEETGVVPEVADIILQLDSLGTVLAGSFTGVSGLLEALQEYALRSELQHCPFLRGLDAVIQMEIGWSCLFIYAHSLLKYGPSVVLGDLAPSVWKMVLHLLKLSPFNCTWSHGMNQTSLRSTDNYLQEVLSRCLTLALDLSLNGCLEVLDFLGGFFQRNGHEAVGSPTATSYPAFMLSYKGLNNLEAYPLETCAFARYLRLLSSYLRRCAPLSTRELQEFPPLLTPEEAVQLKSERTQVNRLFSQFLMSLPSEQSVIVDDFNVQSARSVVDHVGSSMSYSGLRSAMSLAAVFAAIIPRDQTQSLLYMTKNILDFEKSDTLAREIFLEGLFVLALVFRHHGRDLAGLATMVTNYMRDLVSDLVDLEKGVLDQQMNGNAPVSHAAVSKLRDLVSFCLQCITYMLCSFQTCLRYSEYLFVGDYISTLLAPQVPVVTDIRRKTLGLVLELVRSRESIAKLQSDIIESARESDPIDSQLSDEFALMDSMVRQHAKARHFGELLEKMVTAELMQRKAVSAVVHSHVFPKLNDLLSSRYKTRINCGYEVDQPLFASTLETIGAVAVALVETGQMKWDYFVRTFGPSSFWMTGSTVAEHREIPVRFFRSVLELDTGLVTEYKREVLNLWFLSAFDTAHDLHVDFTFKCALNPVLKPVFEGALDHLPERHPTNSHTFGDLVALVIRHVHDDADLRNSDAIASVLRGIPQVIAAGLATETGKRRALYARESYRALAAILEEVGVLAYSQSDPSSFSAVVLRDYMYNAHSEDTHLRNEHLPQTLQFLSRLPFLRDLYLRQVVSTLIAHEIQSVCYVSGTKNGRTKEEIALKRYSSPFTVLDASIHRLHNFITAHVFPVYIRRMYDTGFSMLSTAAIKLMRALVLANPSRTMDVISRVGSAMLHSFLGPLEHPAVACRIYLYSTLQVMFSRSLSTSLRSVGGSYILHPFLEALLQSLCVDLLTIAGWDRVELDARYRTHDLYQSIPIESASPGFDDVLKTVHGDWSNNEGLLVAPHRAMTPLVKVIVSLLYSIATSGPVGKCLVYDYLPVVADRICVENEHKAVLLQTWDSLLSSLSELGKPFTREMALLTNDRELVPQHETSTHRSGPGCDLERSIL